MATRNQPGSHRARVSPGEAPPPGQVLTPPARPWDVGRCLQNRGHSPHTWATPLSDTSTLTSHSHFWCLPFIKHNQNVQNDTGFARNQRKWPFTPAHAPACRAQPAEGAGRQDFGHWVVQAHLVRVAPKALEETMTGRQVSDGPGLPCTAPPNCCSPSTPSPTQQLTSTHPPRPSSLNQAPQASGLPAALAGRQALCASPRPHWRVHIPRRRDQARQLSGVHPRLLPCKDPNLTSTTAPSGPF